jgi:hypothetical protein
MDIPEAGKGRPEEDMDVPGNWAHRPTKLKVLNLTESRMT